MTLTDPFGLQITVQMGWSRGNEGKRAVLGVVVFGIWFWDAAGRVMGVRR